jgi:hypothetical protein
MQKCHGQAQKFDDFLAIASLAPKVIGSTPELFRSSTAIEHVAFSSKSGSGETRGRSRHSLIATHHPQFDPDRRWHQILRFHKVNGTILYCEVVPQNCDKSIGYFILPSTSICLRCSSPQLHNIRRTGFRLLPYSVKE